IQHRNVLPILGISSCNDHPLSIVMPFAINGNAFNYLASLEALERPGNMIKIVHNIASALEYLHGMLPPIIHGDIHARNILIDAEGQGLLCDFGLSRIKHEQTRTSTGIVEGGKLRYLAPELLANCAFRSTMASDCYAFAMTILELATLQKPFAEYENERAASNAAEQGFRPKQPPMQVFGALGEQTVHMLWVVVSQMWDQEPANQPSIHHVCSKISEISTCHLHNPSPEPG
ncbi:kinase-like protein, partial [Clavulina sp. PMI_390]